MTDSLNALITGGNAGLGLQTAKVLCSRGYKVIITARSAEKAIDAINEIRSEIKDAKVVYEVVELKSLRSVHEFGRSWREKNMKIDILINNAGIMNTPFELTEDGFEAQFQVNHLSHALLTHYVLPSVLSNDGSGLNKRVICVSSRAHLRWSKSIDMDEVFHMTKDKYDGWACYGRSKLCNILFTKTLAKLFPLESSKTAFNSLHPGVVATKLLDAAPGLSNSALSVDDGIRGMIRLATAEDVNEVTGQYFHDDGNIASGSQVSSWALSDVEADKAWDATLRYLSISPEDYGK